MNPSPQPHYGGTIDLNDTNDPRTRIVNLVPPGSRVLEVGCGSGTIAAFLQQAKGCQVLAIEPQPEMAAEARRLGLTVQEWDIEDPACWPGLQAAGPFEAVIFADVLEHLRDPGQVLRSARAWLAPDGAVLASIPNVAHWSVRLMLLRGKWEYTQGYLMDSTHLRWFTRASIGRMFSEAGYQLTDFQVRWAAFPGDRLWRRLLPGRTRLYAALARALPGLFGYQFVVRAK